jgi:hypothetical protein
MNVAVGLLCIAAVFLAAGAFLLWALFVESRRTGNDADKLAAQFNSEWPTFVGKPTDKSH